MNRIVLLLVLVIAVCSLAADRAIGYGVSEQVSLNTFVPPTGLTAIMENENVFLTWNAVDGILVGYNVFRNGEQINPAVIYDTNYTDIGVIGGYIYEYYVTAIYSEGESWSSNKVIINLATGRYLSGTVKDQGGIAIEGSLVNVVAHGINMETISMEDGSYSFGEVMANQVNITASKEGYQTATRTMTLVQGMNYCYLVLYEEGYQSSVIQITDALSIQANTVEQNPTNFYTLSGNVTINDILLLPGSVTVDMRSNLVYPRISFSEGAIALNIDGINEQVIPYTGFPITYTAANDNLVPLSFEFFIGSDEEISGFEIEIGRLIIGETPAMGKYVEVMGLLKPTGKSFFAELLKKENWIEQNESPRLYIPDLESVSVSVYYAENTGLSYGCNIQGVSCNFWVFSIEDFSLWIDQANDIFGGSLTLRIPGVGQLGRAVTSSEELLATPVHVTDSISGLTTETYLEQLIEFQRHGIFHHIEIGAMLEFAHGQLNSLSLIPGGFDIPIYKSGAFIREISGGVYDLAVNDLRIQASVDIGLHSRLDLPEPLGPVVYLNDVGTVIKPWNYFEGSGEFQVFKQPLSDGKFFYDGNLGALGLEGNAKIMMQENNPGSTIFDGKLYGSIHTDNFSAGMNAEIRTPDDLPRLFFWAQGITLASAQASIDNFDLSAEITYFLVKLAKRVVYGKDSFPWFHYYIGRNLNSLHQIWRGTRDGRFTIDFQVPENSGQILIVAGNDINLFDYTVVDPHGTIYNSTFSGYHQFPDVYQTVMVIDFPAHGDWTFSTAQEGEIFAYFELLNQPPSALVKMPDTRRSRSNNIQISMTDYSDTLNVKVYYDTESRHFNGVLIQEFEVINNADIDFVWHNSDIENGEYFIYTRIDDGKNAPVMQYAPGSIIVENYFVEAPQNVTAYVENDSIYVAWGHPSDSDIIVTEIVLRDFYNKSRYSYTIVGDNHYLIGDVPTGREYEVKCRFGNSEFKFSDFTSGGTIVYTGGVRNNPPYFTMDPDDVWVFVENQQNSYELSAVCPHGGAVTYGLLDEETGMSITGTTFSWTPTSAQRGFYQQPITATNASGQDVLYQQIAVYSEEQAEIRVSFSSFNLYEADNMFIKINNLYSDQLFQDVTITNLSSNEQFTVQCRRVNKFEYIGQFTLSVNNRTEIIVEDGDELEASYSYEGQTYNTLSIYSSNPQPSDDIPPAAIDDLQALYVDNNSFRLRWTATGDDGHEGRAYRYDVRYSYQPINEHDDFLVAYLYNSQLYPSIAGETDSLLVNLYHLENYAQQDSVYFAIIVEDAHQNRSDVSNYALYTYLAPPHGISAVLVNDTLIELNWTDIHSREEVEFIGYTLQREHNSIIDTLVTNLYASAYSDTIVTLLDGPVKYGVKAVYETGSSGIAYSNTINLNRLVDLRIYCQKDSLYAAPHVSYSITAQDTLYQQSFDGMTGVSGVILIDNIYKSLYQVMLEGDGLFPSSHIIDLTGTVSEFVLDMYSALPPEEIHIEIDGSNINLSWEAVQGASHYKIYTSENPSLEGWGEPIAVVSEPEYTEVISGEKRFYRIVACKEFESDPPVDRSNEQRR